MSFPVIRDATTGSQVAPSFLASIRPLGRKLSKRSGRFLEYQSSSNRRYGRSDFLDGLLCLDVLVYP